MKVTSTFNAKATVKTTVTPTVIVTKQTTATITQTVSTDTTTAVTATTTVAVANATATAESLSLQITNSNTTADSAYVGANINGTVVRSDSVMNTQDFVFDPETGNIVNPDNGFILAFAPSVDRNYVQFYNPDNLPASLSPIQCEDSCGEYLFCVWGQGSPLHWYLGENLQDIIVSLNHELPDAHSMDLIVTPAI